MNLRKRLYFKPLCLLVAALFTGQCISIERKLVSTEEKVIENESQEFIYELEKIKAPSAQDPTIEYKIAKFPANRIQSINVYKKIKKANLWGCFLGGLVAGAFLGTAIGWHSEGHDDVGRLMNGFCGFFVGALTGGISAPLIGKEIEKKQKKHDLGQVKLPAGSYLKKKSDSTPMPIRDFPLEFKWRIRGKSNSFKTQTNEQGIVRINLVDDLKITKFPPERPLTLYIHYLNLESQKDTVFEDSLVPKK